MADISKITIPAGTYDIKDATARTQIAGKANAWHTHTPMEIIPGGSNKAGSLDLITSAKIGSTASNKTFGLPAAAIKIEYSINGGSSWTDYGATDTQKRDLFNETRGFSCYIGHANDKSANSTNNRLRITIEPTDRYCSVMGVYLWFSTQGNTCVLDLETSTIGAKDTFATLFTDKPISGWSGNNIIYFHDTGRTFGGGSTQTGNNYKYRMTFRQTAINANNASGIVMDIRFLGMDVWNPGSVSGVANMLMRNHMYYWDRDYNVVFPAKVTASSFNGYTIASNVPSGAKFTDTTYSSGTGISVSGTTINHSNSVTAQNTQAVYPIKIDAQGHISAYGSAVTIPSAVTESTVSGWGFTKNTGTITGIKMNGASKGTSGVVDLGTVITAHQSISGKVDKINITAQNTQAIYPIKINAQGQITAYGTGITFGSDTTKFLRNDGTWATAGGGSASKITENTLFDISGSEFYINSYSELDNYDILDYIKFPSGSYINTGIPAYDHMVEGKFYDPAYKNDEHWFGTSNNGNYFHFTTYSNKYYWGLNNNQANAGSWTAGEHTVIYNEGSTHAVKLDGTTLGSGADIWSSTQIFIGRRDSSSNFEGRVYYFKITNKTTGELVRDLVPAKHKSNGTIGFFDRVSEKFFANAGSGTFTYGSIVS